ncbi:MAG: hypothetical protein IPN69_17790 [Acidobacteria bacterium]|nr:hypothetical protein [Acidobacteriota bacterium]
MLRTDLVTDDLDRRTARRAVGFQDQDFPTKDALDASFAKDVEILKGRQRGDGSFGLWSQRKERYEYPFLTVHVAHALRVSKGEGLQGPRRDA